MSSGFDFWWGAISSGDDDTGLVTLTTSSPGYLVVYQAQINRYALRPGIVAGETMPIKFDFGPVCADKAFIQSADVVCSVHSGTDTTPYARIIGMCATTPSDTVPALSQTQVQQSIGGMIAGVTYCLTCHATLSDGRSLIAYAYLICLAP